jgi:hypothetical protein
MKMMNERIEELAREAGHVYVGGHTVPYYQFSNNQLKKFAELIVRECLNNMENCNGDLDFAIWKTKQDFAI